MGLAQAQGLEVSASTIHRHSQRAVLVRPSTKRRRPRHRTSPRPPYTCYLYAAMDIYSRYKVGLILPTLVGSDAQGAVTG